MRRRTGWFAIALLLTVAVEIAVLIVVGKAIGAGLTLLLVLATSLLGSWLVRVVGTRSWQAVRADVQAGRPPGNAAIEGLLALVGAVLLLLPGFVTDVIGALLLIPVTRRLARRLVVRSAGGRLSPDALNSLFGPRLVRARTGAPTATPGDATEVRAGQVITDSKPIEGELIDPR